MAHRVALFANKGSRQIAEIARAVEAEGGVPETLDIRIGGNDAPSFRMTARGARWGHVDFSGIRAVHVRCRAPGVPPVLPPLLNDATHAERRCEFQREQSRQGAVTAFFEHLASLGLLVANRLTGAYIDHESKGQFHLKLARAGVPAPRGISSNDAAAVRRFVDEVGECVVKPAAGIGSTRAVTDDDMTRLDEIRLCPAFFQERVRGETLRVHIVGETVVLVLRILADGVDSRTETRGFEPTELTSEQNATMVRANALLGLHYAAWDVIRDGFGSIHCLDCNPGPYIMWLGDDQRRHVFVQLARFLLSFAETNSLPLARGAVAPFA